MATMQPICSKTPEAAMKSVQLTRMLKNVSFMNTNKPSEAAFKQGCQPLPTTQRNCTILPGTDPENSLIVREALRMNLPHHLVLRSVQNRFHSNGSNFNDLKDLVIDLFAKRPSEDGEVPMETNQLEDAMMMSSPVVKRALRMGVPPHLIKPKLRAKILFSGACYPDVNELLSDLNLK